MDGITGGEAKVIMATAGGLFFSWLGSIWELAFFAFGFMILDYIRICSIISCSFVGAYRGFRRYVTAI